jgi:hypothetical protein
MGLTSGKRKGTAGLGCKTGQGVPKGRCVGRGYSRRQPYKILPPPQGGGTSMLS